MSRIIVRRAKTPEDGHKTLELIVALANFEKLAPPDEMARSRFIFDGFERNPPRFEVWLAETDGLTVGYALVFETYSSFLCKPTLYLEDLFVLPDHRHQGIGKTLLNHCKTLAVERNCGRMEWTCLDWNTKAQNVYESIGAVKMSEWLLYRLTVDAILALE